MSSLHSELTNVTAELRNYETPPIAANDHCPSDNSVGLRDGSAGHLPGGVSLLQVL